MKEANGIMFECAVAHLLTNYMEFTCGIWYEGILAHYHVVETGTNTFAVRLLNCITKAAPAHLPRKILLQKKGAEWVSDHPNRSFIMDLVGTITENSSITSLVDTSN
jgi:hypothetical protein